MENSVPEEVSKKWERYIVFVGNLSFSSTKEEVEEYFEKCEGLTGFRLLTKPQGGSKGCGFLEFDNISSQQKALKFHHTTFKGRRINVEETCGGGGNSDSRKEKIKLKNRKRTEKSKKQKTKSEETKNEKEKSGDEKLSELPVTDVETGVEDINQSSQGSKSKKRKLNKSEDGSNDKAAQTLSPETEEASSKKKKKKKHKHKDSENPEEEAKIPRITPSVLDSEELQEDKTKKKRIRERSHDEAEALSVEIMSEETSSKKKKKKKHKHKETNIENTEEDMEIPRLEPSRLDSERLQEGKKKNKRSRENGQSGNSQEAPTNSSDLGMSNVDDSIGDFMASKKKKKKKH